MNVSGKERRQTGGRGICSRWGKTVSLDMADSPLAWGEGYKLVAGVRGGAGGATSPYTLANIQVSYETVPEPATASLGMLGLGALVFRRSRNR